MMKAVYAITRRSRIPLRVLMEKRMACGIGVCFSCVCRTRGAGGQESCSRVCMDGPIFNADEIVWQ
jgi:dihydroorotate dehydrogenase electron transfer subunit